MFNDKKLRVVLSLLIAVGLWVYVMGEVDPTVTTHISDIQVSMHNEDVLTKLDLKATLEGPETISIQVSGKRSEINKLANKEIRAYIDVSTSEYGENTKEIELSMPSGVTGITIESMSDEEATYIVE